MASAQVWFWVPVVLSLSFIPLPANSTYSGTTFLSNPLATSPAFLANGCTKRPTHTTLPMHQPMFVRWNSRWAITAFTIGIKWYRLSFRNWVDERGPRIRHCARGRTLTSAAVSNQGAFGPKSRSWAVTQLPAIADDGIDVVGTHRARDSGRYQRGLFSQVQTFPRWVESEARSIPTRTRRVAAVERGQSIPIPSSCGTKAIRIQSRYQSLLDDGNGLASPLDKTYPFAQSTEEPNDSAASTTEQLSVLFVGVNISVEDPEHDAEAFRTAFQAPTTGGAAIRFTSLAGADATLSNIKGWLLWLDLQATLNGSKMLVFLSGLGSSTNCMCLSDDASISESDLSGWLSTTRTRLGLFHSKPVTVVTDICREGTNPPKASPSGVVSLVWSCSLGQRSHAMAFEDPAVPMSCFWLALLRTCKDVGSSSAEFEAAFLRELDELGRFLLYSHKVWHKGSEICDNCSNELGGRCAPPELQVPEGSEAGWEGIYQLAMVIMKNYHGSVAKIDAWYLKQMKLYNFPVAPDPTPAPRAGRTTGHTRGASHPVSQT